MKARYIIIANAIRHNGNWEKIYKDIQDKVYPTDKELEQAKSVKCITILDEEYPSEMKQAYKPPFVLFYEGNIALLNNNNEDNVAYMGTREPTEYATNGTNDLIDQDYHKTIITGLTKGISAIATERAIANKKNVIGVLPCGLQAMTNDQLGSAMTIINNNGLIITEYPDNVAQTNDSSVMRNRIIVSLSHELRIPEVTEKSSVNMAISMALMNGKDISVLPHSAYAKCINNRLIQEGANVLTLA